MPAPLLALLSLLGCGDKDGVSDDAGLETEDLGSHTTDTGGLTGDIPLNVPDDASSVMVHCGSYGYDTLGTAWEIRAPDDSRYYTNENHEAYAPTKMRVGNLDDHLPVLFPVSPDHDLSAGTWQINAWIASGGAPRTVSCEAVYRVDEVGSSASVDLRLVFVGLDSMELDAARGPDDADLQAALSHAGSLWGEAGLSIGEVEYLDFSGNVDKYSVVDITDTDLSELGELVKQDSDAGRALTVFLVQEISGSGGATILGLAAGPPGAATIGGTSKSGMVVTMADLRADPSSVGLILAHEGAHFLGLFHTSEKAGDRHDPLSDTPECSSSANTDGNGYVDRNECAGKGADNVMFWAPAVDVSTRMSSDQGWVLRRNPATR